MSEKQKSKVDSQNQTPQGFTREEILTLFPPQWEQSTGRRGDEHIIAQVSRNAEGKIVYVVPGSTTRVISEDLPTSTPS